MGGPPKDLCNFIFIQVPLQGAGCKISTPINSPNFSFLDPSPPEIIFPSSTPTCTHRNPTPSKYTFQIFFHLFSLFLTQIRWCILFRSSRTLSTSHRAINSIGPHPGPWPAPPQPPRENATLPLPNLSQLISVTPSLPLSASS